MQSSIISKLMSVLTLIGASRTPLTFSELVVKSGLNKSTMHRLLAIGVAEDVVQMDKSNKTYLLGAKVFDLVRNAYSGYDIQAVALDEMVRLHAVCDSNVTIGVPSGLEVVYLRMLEAKHALGSHQRPGMREPMHCSASGKALCAFLPDSVVAAKFDGYDFAPLNSRTITSQEAFLSALQQVRILGYATNDREEYDHLVGISAPIFNYMSEPVAVLNIWSPHARYSLQDLEKWAPDLIGATQRVTALIGGRSPDPQSFGT
ncbi:IclR family transcriptional regulator C-terminal domain-containing protein [Pseudosulfitobacter sp. SM2401]|uniref:IclR family transcriptional regulator n=1 Tax=Pseudosulfitobacter sp. SM2401 TaxID=3350098 RepID=UPI0036F2B053